MLAAHEATFERQCLDQVRALMAEAPWTVLPDAARTTDLRTRAFCMLSALGCLCHEMRVRHANFPFCVFGLVREGSAEAEAQALLAKCPEMHDAWSAAFVGYYKDRPGGLCSPEAKAELLHTLSIAKREIAQIEAGHASVRRGLVMHSVQTHTLLFKHVSAQMVTQRMRKVSHMLRPGWKRPVASRSRAAPAEAPDRPESARPRRGPRRGHGGAWRAFIREQCAFVRGTPNFAGLSEIYRNLPQDEMVRLRERGRQATRAAREGDNKPFGETARDVERRAENVTRRAELEDVRKQREGPSASLAQELALTSRAPLAEVARGTTAWARLHDLRRRLRLESLDAAARRREEEDAIVEYYNVTGNEELGIVTQAISAMRGRRLEFIPSGPLHSFRQFTWCPPQVMHRVVAGLSVTAGSYHSKMLSSLSSLWARLHETIDHTRMSVFDDDEGPDIADCREAGMCLCDQAGQATKAFIKKMDVAVKKGCPGGSYMRDQLCNAEFVFCFIGQAKPPEEELCASDARRNGLLEGQPVIAERWLHVGTHCKSPWRSSFHALACVHRHPRDAPVATQARAEATLEFCTVFEAVAAFDKGLRWCLCLYKVVWSSRPLGTFAPNVVDLVTAERVDDAGTPLCRLVWQPPWYKPKRKKRKAAFHSGWGEVHLCDSERDHDQRDHDENHTDADVALQVEDGEQAWDDLGFDDPDELSNDGAELFMGLSCDEGDEEAIVEALPGDDGDLLVDVAFPDDALQEDDSDDASVRGIIEEALQLEPEVAEPAAPPAEQATPLAEAEGPLAEPDGPPSMLQPPPLRLAHAHGLAPAHGGDGDDPPWPAYLDIRVALPGGTITWYYVGSRSGDLVAACTQAHHKCAAGCRKHRVRHGNGRRAEQGRPLGYLAAWLHRGLSEDCLTGALHKVEVPSLAERRLARAALRATREGRALLAKERPTREDEESEPEICP